MHIFSARFPKETRQTGCGASDDPEKPSARLVWTTAVELQAVTGDTYTHDDSHALALVRERENLQDGEIEDLTTRGPQLHGRLISSHQR